MASPKQPKASGVHASFLKSLQESVDKYGKELEEERKAFLKDKAEYERERTALDREKEFMGEGKLVLSDVIELNVGGQPFTTTRATLCAQPDTRLAVMFSGRAESSVGGEALQRDKKGVVFLDLDPSLFSILLNHLRTIQLTPPPPTPPPTTNSPGRRTAGGRKLPTEQVPQDKRRMWDTMLLWLGFITPPTPRAPGAAGGPVVMDADVPTTFARELCNANFDILEGGAKVLMRKDADGGASELAALGETVGRGCVVTWKLRIVLVGSREEEEHKGNGFRFGILNGCESVTEGLRRELTERYVDDNDCGVYWTASTSLYGPTDKSVSKKSKETSDWRHGETLEILLDTTDEDAPFFKIETFSNERVRLPKQWESFRMFGGAWKEGQGFEIVSVE